MLKELGGQYLLFAAGYPKRELEIYPNEVHYLEIKFIGKMGANIQDFQLAGDLISNKFIDVVNCAEGEIFELEEIQTAYEGASELGNYRITIKCN